MLFQRASKILQRPSLRIASSTFPCRGYGLVKGAYRSVPRYYLLQTGEGSSSQYFPPLYRSSVRQNYGEARYFHCSSVLGDIKIISTPPFPDSVTEGDIRWEKAVGDSVEEDEVVGEIETDKTALPVSSPSAGVIAEFLVEDGDTVAKGQELFKLDVSGGGEAVTKAEEQPVKEAKEELPEVVEKPVEREIPTVPPPVPEKPTEPLKTLKPTPVPMSSRPAPSPATAPADRSSPLPSAGGTRNETRVKISRIRQRIAQRLKEAQNTTAMLTTFNEVDMSNVMEMRQKHKESFLKKHNVKLGFMSAFVKASAHALEEIPVVNAVIDDDNNQIIYRDYIDISVAVATPKGLVVPVIRNVETMNFADIEKTINTLGVKARDGDLAIEEMDGGTFTISNGGVFGSLMGTPIINPPQSAILGIHAINDRPVAINGKVEIRPMMYLALTYDHRLIDGREAVTFLRKIKSTVEDPRIILLDL